jgi:hypothetical protein
MKQIVRRFFLIVPPGSYEILIKSILFNLPKVKPPGFPRG